MSIEFYERNAEAFFQGTVNADMEDARTRFLSCVPADGQVLDAGCGSGRDALAFARAGYTVTAFDASTAMVELARAHSGLAVLKMTFDDVTWQGHFDGIWASASLLHVPRTQLPAAIARLARALRLSGAIYVSMKRGTTEREVQGRFFTDVSEEELSGLLAAAGLTCTDTWVSADVRPGRSEEFWVNAIAIKGGSRAG